MRGTVNKKGQAMTELVISIPVIVLLLGGMLQFFMVMQDKVKLLMLEHELVMFNSTTGTGNMRNMSKFAREYADEIGLEGELKVLNLSVQDYIPSKNFAEKALKWVMDFFPEISDTVYGRDIRIEYKHSLRAPFRFLTADGTIKLSTRIHSGVGDVWDMDMRPSHIMKVVLNKVISGASWFVNGVIKFFSGRM